LINIIGGVCVLLWGLRGVKNAMTRAFGASLHAVVTNGTRNRVVAFLSGLGVTAILQSSMAMSLLVSSFTGKGILPVSAALAVMLGADVGTTLVAQALSFDLSWLKPALLIVGFVLFSMYDKQGGKVRHAGKMLLSLGFMLLALGWIKESAAPLKDSETLIMVLESLQKDPIFAVLLVTIITWVFHSSLAMVLLLMTLVTNGVLSVEVGMAMVLGANMGGVIPPFIATLKDNAATRRVTVGNLIIRLIGVIITLPFLSEAQAWLELVDDNPTRMIVNFHTWFNLTLALEFLPLTKVMDRAVAFLLPDKVNLDDPHRAKYLDDRELETPVVALSSASREVLHMADTLESMLEDTIKTFQSNNESLVARIRERDNVIDSLYKAIKLFMTRLTQGEMDSAEGRRYLQILNFSTNIEHAGDIIDKSLMVMAEKKIRDQKRFSVQGMKEIENIHYLVLESVRLAQTVFETGDLKLARQMIESKDRLRRAEQEATVNHFDRLRGAIPETIATSSLHLDIVRDYRRVNTHMCTIAYSLLENEGQLRASRLKSEFEKEG
jgi:phosphate:Na+ symporter